jgi:acylphosphatase
MQDPVPERTAVLVRYSGTVQGVGFRATARRMAHRYPVAGWVRNLPDGRVELWAEGSAKDVDAFLNAIQTAWPIGYIDKVDTTLVEPSGDARFEIRY